MKGLTFAIVMLVVVSCLVGCGDSKEEGLIIGLVTDVGGRGDKSFNESAIRGLEEWAGGVVYEGGKYKKLTEEKLRASLPKEIKGLPYEITPMDIVPKVIESKSNMDYEDNMKLLIKKGAKLVIGVGFMLRDTIGKVAREYPDVKFLLIDAYVTDEKGNEITLPNLRAYTFPEHEGSFLVGAIAGLATKNNKIGFVGGMEVPLIKKFEAGYKAGVWTTNPTAYSNSIETIYTGNFDNPTDGKKAAETIILRGADVIYHASGSCGTGVIEACDKNKVYAIGVDSDQSHLAPNYVLTSMIKHVDLSVYLAIKAFIENKDYPGNLVLSLKEAGVAYANIISSVTDREKIIEKVENLRSMIQDGKIIVPKTMEELKNFVPPENF